jgi:PAS domain S-box-containing protein
VAALPSAVGREAELAALFLEAPTALVHADAAGIIRSANAAAARLMGRRVDEMVGRPVDELVDPSIRPTWLEGVRRETGSGRACEGEVFLSGSGSEPIPAGVVARERGDGSLLFGIADLTRQKTMEKQFFESKKLASLGRVVEGVAHEVRNPIIAIGGFARKLARQVQLGADGRRYLDVILAEAQRLEKMVREIEEYVDLTKHRRPSFAPVDVGAVLEEALGAARRRFDAQAVRVEWVRPAGLPSMFGDQALLDELFRGLVENACDAMPGGGHLHGGIECSGNWLRVRLSDSGVGIPESELEEIFNPFVSSKTTGAGLGLAKAYMIVEEHSGMIEFESEVGKGTVCTVSLPVDRRRVARAYR